MCNLGSLAGLDVAPLGLSNVCPNLDFRILEEVSPGNNNVLTWVRICVPPPQEAEQAAQAPHSRPDGQDVPTLQDWDCFLGSIKSDCLITTIGLHLIQVPFLPFLSHWTLLLRSIVPVPQDAEQLDQLLHGSDTGRGAVEDVAQDI